MINVLRSEAKMKDIAILLENKPGTLASLGETLGKENINIEGICGAESEGEGIIHIFTDEPGKAYHVLEQAGFKIKEQRDVLIIGIKDIAKKPGSGGKLFRKLADENVNIDFIYLAGNNRLIIGVDDLEKASTVL